MKERWREVADGEIATDATCGEDGGRGGQQCENEREEK